QEDMSQFDLEIAYIPGEDNPAADALSRIRAGALPSDHTTNPSNISDSNVELWKSNPFLCASVLSLSADKEFLSHIKAGYATDPFVMKLIEGGSLVPNVAHKDGLWFVSNRLVI
ncbi:hypothetical protein GG344DRAFT_21286, partial [Lentinula edodes]